MQIDCKRREVLETFDDLALSQKGGRVFAGRVGGTKRGTWRKLSMAAESALEEAGGLPGAPLGVTEGPAEVGEQDLSRQHRTML